MAAAAEAAAAGGRVLLADEGVPGAMLAPGPTLDAVRLLAGDADRAGVEVLDRHGAIGIYEDPSVPLVGPRELVEIETDRVIVATGAVEAHGVFPGNDLPGVWLARGAARLAAVHGVSPGEHAVVVAAGDEGASHAETLRATGIDVTLVNGEVHEARGIRQVGSVTVETAGGPPSPGVRRPGPLARLVPSRRVAPDVCRARGRRCRRRRRARLHRR